MPGWSLEWDRHTVGVSSGQVSQVTYPDPAGFITRENGCDIWDAAAYRFNLGCLLQTLKTFSYSENNVHPVIYASIV